MASATLRTGTTPPWRVRLGAWRQWPRDTRDTLFQLVLIGWTVLPHLANLALWCSAFTAVVLLWRARLALASGPLPGRWTLALALAAAVGLTFWSEQSLLGKTAGVTLLVLLMALKTLELRARRDALVVFFLGFFLVLTHCLYSQSLLTALHMLLATWGLLTAVVLANMPVGKPPLWRAASVAARSALLGLPLMAALFLLFPRFGPLWGLPQDAGGRTGLSGTLRLGGMADLANDETIAMRVRFTGTAPPDEALYFRGPVLPRFDGEEWRPSVFAGGRQALRPQDLQLAGAPVAYELMLEAIRLPLLPLLEATPPDPALAGQLPDWTIWQGQDLQWHTDRLVGERLRLQVRSWPRFSHGQRIEPHVLAALLDLPDGYNLRTLAWARQLRAQLGEVDARTAAAAVLAHIRQDSFVYTLQPGSFGRDAIDEFWLDRREGFCEHFATAFVVVLRAMGVPARVVTGYQGAEPPDADGFRVVRQSHAHAWAEFWVPGEGWQRADPTAAVAPERVRASRPLPPQPGLVAGALNSMSPALASQIRRAWELLDSRWNQWVMGYSRTSQFDLLARLGVRQPDWADVARALVLLLSALACAGAVWAWLDRRRQDPWQRLQARLVQRLRAIGVDALPHHPPRTLAGLVRSRHGTAGEALAQALDGLDQWRYAPGAQPTLPGARWWATVQAEVRRLRGTAAALPDPIPAQPGGGTAPG